ncbi:hypothetical protein Sango_1090800 [Sesamum angolense]|uniref:AB hydrolase-1 domain-containing protein n=1 Tax=Sesamum angolense TaxID=2727404 RepID=A0AAE1WUJ4_9LAMI|nr:hypothetical protein Sango_1090800 [Sesamum angolense]
MLIVNITVAPPIGGPKSTGRCMNHGRKSKHNFKVLASEFPAFLPSEVEKIKDPFARKLASRIERLPVHVNVLPLAKFFGFLGLSLAKTCIMSSCVKPKTQLDMSPLVLLHGFDSSCLEWRYTLPLLEDAGLETWAIDVLGWGFSDLEKLPSCSVASKRDHLYQGLAYHFLLPPVLEILYKRPMTLVGPSLGAAVAIDFVIKYPEAVDKLILIDASVYAEGTGNLAKLPKLVAYAGVSLLKSLPLRLYATSLTFNSLSWSTCFDWANIGRLHCLLPWWEDATVDFMISGGYNVSADKKGEQFILAAIPHEKFVVSYQTSILVGKMVKQKTLIIWGEDDQIIDNKLAVRLHCELPNAIIRQLPDCGHIPHVEKPAAVSKLIKEFVQAECEIAIPSFILS